MTLELSLKTHIPGQVWWYKNLIKKEANTSVIKKDRPCIILRTEGTTALIVPFTHSSKGFENLGYYNLDSKESSYLAINQIQTVTIYELIKYVGTMKKPIYEKILQHCIDYITFKLQYINGKYTKVDFEGNVVNNIMADPDTDARNVLSIDTPIAQQLKELYVDMIPALANFNESVELEELDEALDLDPIEVVEIIDDSNEVKDVITDDKLRDILMNTQPMFIELGIPMHDIYAFRKKEKMRNDSDEIKLVEENKDFLITHTNKEVMEKFNVPAYIANNYKEMASGIDPMVWIKTKIPKVKEISFTNIKPAKNKIKKLAEENKDFLITHTNKEVMEKFNVSASQASKYRTAAHLLDDPDYKPIAKGKSSKIELNKENTIFILESLPIEIQNKYGICYSSAMQYKTKCINIEISKNDKERFSSITLSVYSKNYILTHNDNAISAKFNIPLEAAKSYKTIVNEEYRILHS